MKKILSRIIGTSGVIRIKEKKLFSKHPEFKRLLRNNIEFENIHKNKRCFILGNGPSLADFNLSLLQNEYTLTVNQLSRRTDFKNLNANYHFWVDQRFFNINDNNPEDLELLETMKKVKTVRNNPVVFYSLEAYPLIKKYHLDEFLNIRYIGLESMPLNSAIKQKMDYSRLTLAFPTVVQSVICMAVYMGFKEIYLLGCDCTGFITIAQTHLHTISDNTYGYSLSENEKKRMFNVSKLSSIRDELQWYVDLFDSYDTLNKYCSNNGVKLFNATEGGLLDSLERVDIYNILQDNKKLLEDERG